MISVMLKIVTAAKTSLHKIPTLSAVFFFFKIKYYIFWGFDECQHCEQTLLGKEFFTGIFIYIHYRSL